MIPLVAFAYGFTEIYTTGFEWWYGVYPTILSSALWCSTSAYMSWTMATSQYDVNIRIGLVLCLWAVVSLNGITHPAVNLIAVAIFITWHHRFYTRICLFDLGRDLQALHEAESHGHEAESQGNES